MFKDSENENVKDAFSYVIWLNRWIIIVGGW